jgi:hypothetical protein
MTTPVDVAIRFTVVDGVDTVERCGTFTGCVRSLIVGGEGGEGRLQVRRAGFIEVPVGVRQHRLSHGPVVACSWERVRGDSGAMTA